MNSTEEMLCIQLIAYAGEAKANFIEAIYECVEGNLYKAEELFKSGKEALIEAHEHHYTLIQKEANNELDKVTLLIVHSEDQLAGAEIFEVVACTAIRHLTNKGV